MFFVATAARDGHVNVSPKGLDSLRDADWNEFTAVFPPMKGAPVCSK